MSYANENIIDVLKKARTAKGLSQRTLSASTGVPQSHLSKIEKGATDIRLSSLIELARVLDLEVKLVPRKSVPAVETVVRSTAPESGVPRSLDTAKAGRDIQRALHDVRSAQALYPDVATLKQLQDSLQTLSNLQSAGRDFTALSAAARRAAAPLHKELTQLHKAAEIFKTLPPETHRTLTEAAKTFEQLRNQFAHSISSPPQPRPAYRLDEDED